MDMTMKPTADLISFQQAYDYFNEKLFGGSLPDCLITLQRKRGARGYFCAAIFIARGGDQKTDEIAMNPEHFNRHDADVLSTLVHEMVHLWQQHFGKPSRNAYHNREWGKKMESVGLIPSDTGMPGGKQTGQKVSHYIVEDGPYIKHANALLESGFTLRWQSDRHGGKLASSAKKSKIKYTCEECGQNAWAKPGAQLACGLCMEAMEPAE